MALLIPHEKLVREPLQKWAGRWLEWVMCQEPSLCVDLRRTRELAKCLNQVALIEFYRGNRLGAECLCWLQIEWIHRLVMQTQAADLLEIALQPWINIGRLQMAEGSFDGAMAKFCVLQEFDRRTLLAIGPIRFTDAAWNRIHASESDLRSRLEAVFVIDSLKCLLVSGQVEEVHSFRRHQSDISPYLHPFFAEAEILAFVAAGSLRIGLDLALRYMNETEGWKRIVFALRVANLLKKMASPSFDDLCVSLLESIQGVDFEQLELPELHIAYQIVRIAAAEGHSEMAVGCIARKVLHRSITVGDEPLVAGITECLLLTSSGFEKDYWRSRHNEVLQRSDYIQFRGSGDRSESHPTVFADLTNAIHQILRGCLEIRDEEVSAQCN